MDNKVSYASIDDYISHCPQDVQDILQRIRSVIREAAPDAKEKIGYQMPGFALDGSLVYFAAFKKHIGFFPTGSDLGALKEEVAPYRSGKGTLQFPLGKPIPYELIGKITRLRVEQNREKAAAKAAAVSTKKKSAKL